MLEQSDFSFFSVGFFPVQLPQSTDKLLATEGLVCKFQMIDTYSRNQSRWSRLLIGWQRFDVRLTFEKPNIQSRQIMQIKEGVGLPGARDTWARPHVLSGGYCTVACTVLWINAAKCSTLQLVLAFPKLLCHWNINLSFFSKYKSYVVHKYDGLG